MRPLSTDILYLAYTEQRIVFKYSLNKSLLFFSRIVNSWEFWKHRDLITDSFDLRHACRIRLNPANQSSPNNLLDVMNINQKNIILWNQSITILTFEILALF